MKKTGRGSSSSSVSQQLPKLSRLSTGSQANFIEATMGRADQQTFFRHKALPMSSFPSSFAGLLLLPSSRYEAQKNSLLRPLPSFHILSTTNLPRIMLETAHQADLDFVSLDEEFLNRRRGDYFGHQSTT